MRAVAAHVDYRDTRHEFAGVPGNVPAGSWIEPYPKLHDDDRNPRCDTSYESRYIPSSGRDTRKPNPAAASGRIRVRHTATHIKGGSAVASLSHRWPRTSQ